MDSSSKSAIDTLATEVSETLYAVGTLMAALSSLVLLAAAMRAIAEHVSEADSSQSQSETGRRPVPIPSGYLFVLGPLTSALPGNSYSCMSCGQPACLWPEGSSINPLPMCIPCASLIGRNN